MVEQLPSKHKALSPNPNNTVPTSASPHTHINSLYGLAEQPSVRVPSWQSPKPNTVPCPTTLPPKKSSSWDNLLSPSFDTAYFFFPPVLGIELRAYTFSHSTSLFFVKGFFEIPSQELFDQANFKL
jgi:hypothetical protein